ncbi:hypothetical protein GOA77_09165 [Sinorhizobium meliloti]|uniref:hypothetical protein n=1 Tax=Rhizobium meliloti TaxID=382 RepID=UPI001295BC82|nr:hypothetical protein [Sinorhizobium meliloti]MDW9902035.1 hypothetical protein [Sinorhizobium meliloti]MQX63564.1 hypothetical protein [Sinorhizobium meliloti]
MRDYSKVSPLIWRDKRFNSLASSDAKLAMLYFATSEHQNSAGCYRLPDGYAAADLGWDVDRYQAARGAVVSSGLILFDEATSELFLVDWFESNPITNGKHAKGTQSLIVRIDSDTIREAAEDAFLASRERFEAGKEEQSSNLTRLTDTRFMNGRR